MSGATVWVSVYAYKNKTAADASKLRPDTYADRKWHTGALPWQDIFWSLCYFNQLFIEPETGTA